jgi:hypothetical protein
LKPNLDACVALIVWTHRLQILDGVPSPRHQRTIWSVWFASPVDPESSEPSPFVWIASRTGQFRPASCAVFRQKEAINQFLLIRSSLKTVPDDVVRDRIY